MLVLVDLVLGLGVALGLGVDLGLGPGSLFFGLGLRYGLVSCQAFSVCLSCPRLTNLCLVLVLS